MTLPPLNRMTIMIHNSPQVWYFVKLRSHSWDICSMHVIHSCCQALCLYNYMLIALVWRHFLVPCAGVESVCVALVVIVLSLWTVGVVDGSVEVDISVTWKIIIVVKTWREVFFEYWIPYCDSWICINYFLYIFQYKSVWIPCAWGVDVGVTIFVVIVSSVVTPKNKNPEFI